MGRYIYDSINQEEIPVYGSGGHTIKNSSGTAMTQRKNLKFVNATVTDDAAGDATIVTTASGDSTNFVGTLEEWEELTQAEQDEYDSVDLTDDYNDLTLDIDVIKSNIGNLSNLETTAKSNLVAAINEVNAKPSGGGSNLMIAGVEETDTASQAYLPEQYLIYEDTLYKVIESITLGDTLEDGENIEAVTLGGEITNHLSVNGTGFYFDSHDGVFGYNTSSSRGADTFVPFKGPVSITYASNISKSGSGSWAGQTYTATIDVSSANILSIARWYHLANHSSMTSSSSLTTNTGVTLYSVPSGVNVASDKRNMYFDVTDYDTLTVTYNTNYSGSLSVEGITLLECLPPDETQVVTYYNHTTYASDRGSSKSVSLSLPAGDYILVAACDSRSGGAFSISFSSSDANIANYSNNYSSTPIGVRIDRVHLSAQTTVTATVTLSSDYSTGYPEQIYFVALKK